MSWIRRGTTGIVLLVLVAMVGGVGVRAVAGADLLPPAPARDSFYTAPDPSPRGGAGTVIRHRAASVNVLGLPVPVRAELVLYRSRTIAGAPAAVSGIVLAPLTPWAGGGARPVVGYAVGTHGIADQCAPSYLLRTGTENEVNPIGRALSRNWALVITDYPGLGTPGVHPFAVGKAEGYAMLDAVRAAQRLGRFGVTTDSQAALWGYSQGGQATAFAAELQPGYAPELRLAGAAAGGVPADLTAVFDNIDGTPWFGLALLAFAGYRAAYPDLPIDSLMNPAGRAALADAEKECTVPLALKFGFHHLDEYTVKPDAVRDPAVAAKFAQNRPGQATPTAPLFLYHAQLDQIIPPALAKDLAAAYCARGTTVQTKTIPVTEHLLGLVNGAAPALAWLADRFAGKPAPTTC